LATKNYFGLDLTSSKQKPSACVSIDNNLRIVKTCLTTTDINIISSIIELQPAVIAIDSPLSLPTGLCCLDEKCPCKPLHEYKGRWSEQMLAKQEIPCYFTTKKSIIKDMVMRAVELRKELEKQGFMVIEIYPYASKRQLFGQLKSKRTSAGIRQLREALNNLLQDNDGVINKWNHDLCDAAMAA
jgi:predicted nuclease with RNAse H fold